VKHQSPAAGVVSGRGRGSRGNVARRALPEHLVVDQLPRVTVEEELAEREVVALEKHHGRGAARVLDTRL